MMKGLVPARLATYVTNFELSALVGKKKGQALRPSQKIPH